MRHLALLLLGVAVALPSELPAQWGGEDPDEDEPTETVSQHMATAPVAHAAPLHGSIAIDGRPDEEAWQAAPVISEFTQVEPNEGAPVSQRTEVRILYDESNLYIAAWLYDEGPVSTRLGRRNSAWPDTDAFIVFLDTYHDHRTAYRFTTNPSGVIRDEIITGGGGGGGGGGGPSGTGFGDTSWDAVWETASSITDEGWLVEIRIPFSQLRFNPGDTQSWGLQLARRIGRNMEHASWSFVPRLERATVARFGHLEGISNIGTGGRLELLPFVASRAEFRDVPRDAAVDFDNPFRSGSDFFADAGLDLKYRLGSNLTLDATVNPDFGQVEMDPAEINLTAFETRLEERRPFFVEGADILRFGGGVGGPGPPGGGPRPQILYSRRIGQAPQSPVPSSAVYADVPVATTILGAVKLTGRSASGWSGGALQAYTARERAPFVDEEGNRERAVVEPAANYLVGRVRRDLHEGRTSFGAILTSTYRDIPSDPALTGRLHSSAMAGGIDFHRETSDRRWAVAGELFGSHVRGDPAALERTQRSSARYFQRPDAPHVALDPGATSLSGIGGEVELARQDGAIGGGVTVSFLSPGVEVNDLGFQTHADRIDVGASLGYRNPRPGRHFRSRAVGISPDATWNFGGQNVRAGLGLFGSFQTLGYYNLNTRIRYDFETWDDRLTRGGPLARSPSSFSMNVGIRSDNRRTTVVNLNGGFSRDAAGGWRWNANTSLTARLTETLVLRTRPSVSRTHNVAQNVRTVSNAPEATETYGSRYVFGSLDQTVFSINFRADVTFSPTLTLETNVEPFVGSGRFGAPMELAAARTFDFLEYGTDIGTVTWEDGRYTIDPDGGGPAAPFQVNDPDFNRRSLIGSAVLRWEWRPGSTFYLVWQQLRNQRLTHFSPHAPERPVGSFELGDDLRDLFSGSAENILMIKFSYWLNP